MLKSHQNGGGEIYWQSIQNHHSQKIFKPDLVRCGLAIQVIIKGSSAESSQVLELLSIQITTSQQ